MKPAVHSFLIQYRREISALFAALAAACALSVVRPHSTHDVVVASHSLSAGHIITTSDLSTMKLNSTWPDATLQPSRIVGQTLAHDVRSGTPVNSTDLLNDALTHLGPNNFAVTIAADPSDSALVSVGDFVDVYSADGSTVSTRSRILALNNDSHVTRTFSSTTTEPIIVSMTHEEIGLLAMAKSRGQVTIALDGN